MAWPGAGMLISVERAGRIISSKRPGIIVVVSDGADTCHGDPCAAAQAIAAAKPNVHINVISIGGETNGAAQCITAQSTGGHVYQPGNAVEMEKAIRQASGEPDVRLCQSTSPARCCSPPGPRAIARSDSAASLSTPPIASWWR